jgi:hypothetical protein
LPTRKRNLSETNHQQIAPCLTLNLCEILVITVLSRREEWRVLHVVPMYLGDVRPRLIFRSCQEVLQQNRIKFTSNFSLSISCRPGLTKCTFRISVMGTPRHNSLGILFDQLCGSAIQEIDLAQMQDMWSASEREQDSLYDNPSSPSASSSWLACFAANRCS